MHRSGRSGTILGGLTLLALLCACALGDRPTRAQEAGRPPRKGAPLVTWSGAHSKIDEPACERVSDAEAWERLWVRHAGPGGDDHESHWRQAPQVDFERCTVVAVFQGRRINCAGLYAESVTEEEARVVLRFDAHGYQTDMRSHAVTDFGIFVLPRTKKPIVVEENLQSRIDGPPEWKERATLK